MSRLLLAPVADGLLAAVQAAFDAEGVELPDRRLVAPGSPGQIAWDCEQLVVALASVTTGTGMTAANLMPMAGTPAGMLPRVATWSIQVVRCTPMPGEDGAPPSAEDLARAAQVQFDDAGVLSQCLADLASATPGSISWIPAGTNINAGAVTPLGPDTHQGVEALLSLTVMDVS